MEFFSINEVKKYVTIFKILIKMTWVCNSTTLITNMYFGQHIFLKFCNVFIKKWATDMKRHFIIMGTIGGNISDITCPVVVLI